MFSAVILVPAVATLSFAQTPALDPVSYLSQYGNVYSREGLNAALLAAPRQPTPAVADDTLISVSQPPGFTGLQSGVLVQSELKPVLTFVSTTGAPVLSIEIGVRLVDGTAVPVGTEGCLFDGEKFIAAAALQGNYLTFKSPDLKSGPLQAPRQLTVVMKMPFFFYGPAPIFWLQRVQTTTAAVAFPCVLILSWPRGDVVYNPAMHDIRVFKIDAMRLVWSENGMYDVSVGQLLVMNLGTTTGPAPVMINLRLRFAGDPMLPDLLAGYRNIRLTLNGRQVGFAAEKVESDGTALIRFGVPYELAGMPDIPFEVRVMTPQMLSMSLSPFIATDFLIQEPQYGGYLLPRAPAGAVGVPTQF